MALSSLLLVLLLLFLAPSASSAASAAPSTPATYGVSYSIDCGGTSNFTSEFGRNWLSDRYFTGGAAGTVAEPNRFSQPQEQTLRFFPPNSFGKKSCYSIPVPPGRYYLRTFTVYDNYDSKLRTPAFDVSLEGTVVFSWRSPWNEAVARSGAYADLIGPVRDGSADLCFYSIATDPPVVASIELFQIDPLAYDAATASADFILVNYGRLSSGSALFGPGFTNDSDLFGRVWQSDADFRNPNVRVKALSSGGRQVLGGGHAHNYFPPQLYLTAITPQQSGEAIEYLLPVDTRMDYMVWFHFAEIDSGINAAGRRVFDIVINGKDITRIDIFKAVGGFTAFKWHHVVKNLTTAPLSLKLVPVVGKPIICGLENYAMVPLDIATVSDQARAMRALKESFKIPDRMGWNGDPCAPTTWDAWEGVTCHRTEKGLVITQLDLGSQGLKGYISDQISLLPDLVGLNLSSNSLSGELPSGLVQKSLVKLDLSGNQFNGNIPESFDSSNLQLVLLNNNELEGQVPEKLYSVGVHGGIIDLSGNKGLCGVPSLPACSFFWDKGKLSIQAKIAIGLSCGVVFSMLLLVYVLCIKRGRNDYDFAPPQDLLSSAMAAKRNRYQRQKLLLEMENQHSVGIALPQTNSH
ncbi:Putative leucine-rich repeat receptor-like serine/threonine-protein kinase [Apostasia shenzhenica]|uniref:Leucine-rich repeat receptor-like serine/threonine-protein kinase n=1 Tax=Apostasia shenzhenica TaxID=1088818 RepID=A0A2I0AM97_9ASPA|nr:Putative leucine-rich repeat receptor-like serine/threonine-protein kinase [Apostasia shenzhenica]